MTKIKLELSDSELEILEKILSSGLKELLSHSLHQADLFNVQHAMRLLVKCVEARVAQ
tara:strand:- start:230 stop:403 length:174 start_codon:yes stop_codon:yes gene_type:complete